VTPARQGRCRQDVPGGRAALVPPRYT
jgi:hypothetical protein